MAPFKKTFKYANYPSLAIESIKRKPMNILTIYSVDGKFFSQPIFDKIGFIDATKNFLKNKEKKD